MTPERVEGNDKPNEEDAPPVSPSLMSICNQSSPVWMQQSSPAAESPSIIVLEEGPCWTSHKALPRPQTPPRTCRSARPVRCGVPEPLSARGREAQEKVPPNWQK